MSANYMSKLFDENVRFEKVIWLPAALAEAAPDDFTEFAEDPDYWDEALVGDLPFLKRFAESDEMPDPEDVEQSFVDHGASGFLVLAANPVMRSTGPGSFTYSWGHYRTRWIYGETIERAAYKALDWARANYEKAKAEGRS